MSKKFLKKTYQNYIYNYINIPLTLDGYIYLQNSKLVEETYLQWKDE